MPASAVLSHYDKSQPIAAPTARAESFAGYRQVIPSHRVASYAKQVRPLEVVVSAPSTVRKDQEHRNAKITKAHTAETVKAALHAWGRDKSAPIARVQQIAAVDRKTAEAWWHGKNPPQCHHLINLARVIPELKGEVRRLLGMEQDLDPDFQREMTALMQRYRR